MAEVLTASTVVQAEPERGRRRTGLVPIIAGSVLALIVLACVVGPWLMSSDSGTALSTDRFAGISGAHWLGTDELGRDLFARVLRAGRISLGVAGGATLVAMLLGAAWGMIAAFSRGLVDEILMRLADVTMAAPQMLLALIFVAAFGATPVKLAVIVGILLTPVTARMIRSAVLTERAEDYYIAAIAFGAPKWRLILTEVLPNVWAPIGVQSAINVANGIILEAALSFIGLGIQDPDISWGLLLKYGFSMQSRSLGYMLYPAATIFVTIWMLNLLADQLGRTKGGRR